MAGSSERVVLATAGFDHTIRLWEVIPNDSLTCMAYGICVVVMLPNECHRPQQVYVIEHYNMQILKSIVYK
jgi:hypothetical protein